MEKSVAKITKADAALFTPQAQRARELTPAERERQEQLEQFRRLIGKLTDADQAFLVRPEGNEKPITIRQRLLRVAGDMNVEIAVRKHGDGFLVGLLTPERRTNRGRRSSAS